jgi:hypothetical protein
MADRIVGISRTSLWNAWKVVRKQLRDSSRRDVVDFLEYDVDPDKWINLLLRRISDGSYEPLAPKRFNIAKSRGFHRRLTFPTIPDLVLYRAAVDYLFTKVRARQHQHVYFEQAELEKATTQAVKEATEKVADAASPYGSASSRRFMAWLHYDQYRKQLILKRIYPYIVVTDITNFFGSILYSRVASALHGLAAPPELIGLLFFLLERLSNRDAYTESPRIGLPVDEFDCSRKLAHMVLFPHDDRVVKLVGEDAYVRWMDDQNIGVSSQADGIRVLAEVDASLARLHLTVNAAKSRVLSLREARREFHLDVNAALDAAEPRPFSTRRERRQLAGEVRRIWKLARKHEGVGQWTKILKRIYRFAGRARDPMLRGRAIDDLINDPGLARRVCDYMRVTGTTNDYVTFAKRVWTRRGQVYEDVNVVVMESLLRLEPDRTIAARLRTLGSQLLTGRVRIAGSRDCAAVGPLLILRFGDRRSLPLLRRTFEDKADRVAPDAVRAAAVVFAGFGRGEFQAMRRAAAKLLRANLADMVRLVERIAEYRSMPGRYKARLSARFDSVEGRKYFDMRAVVAARLLMLNGDAAIKSWFAAHLKALKANDLSKYEVQMVRRLFGA